MLDKINIYRIIVGGITAGFVMHLIDVLVHVVILKENYSAMIDSGIMREEIIASSVIMADLSVIFAGIIIAMLYFLLRGVVGPGPNTALKLGFMLGLLLLPGAFALHAYYNVGGLVAFALGAGFIIQHIIGTLIAAVIYKDKSAPAA
jgi:hypothetical protein